MKARDKKKLGKISMPTYKKRLQESKSTSKNTQADTLSTANVQEVSADLSARYMTPQDLEKELGLSLTLQYKLRSNRFRKLNAEKGRVNLPYIKQYGVIVHDRNDVIKWLNESKIN